jgi:ATP-binding cassette, subfamily B, bacterial
MRRAATVRAALVLPWRAHPGVLAGRLVVAVVAGAAPVVSAWLLRDVLDTLAAGHHAGRLVPLVAGLAVATGVPVALAHLGQYLAAHSGRAIERRASADLYSAVNRLAGLRKLEDPDFQDRLNLAQQAGLSGAGDLFTNGVDTLQSAVTLAGFLATLLTLSPVLGAIVVAATIPGGYAELGLARRRVEVLARLSHAQRRQHSYATLLASIAAAKEIRLFGLGTFFCGRMLAELRRIHRTNERIDRQTLATYSLFGLASAVIAGAGLWWAAVEASRGRLTVGDVAILLAALSASATALIMIVNQGAVAYQAVRMFRSYQEILTEEPDLPVPAMPVPAPALRQGIEFENVWFRYGPDLPWILRGACFFVPLGHTVAIAGHNGAGKSTLVKLLCRFYDPDHGRILWDGVDLRDIDLAGLRDRISTVFQDYMAYELTARENIAVGDLAASEHEARVSEAALRAGVHDALSALPRGYDTMLTRLYFDEDDRDDPHTGVQLSGGQWQRVALARAFGRQGRDLIILDEPSSGLDAEAEYEIHAQVRAHRHGATCVLITHRLNAAREADHILVLADGVIAEQGDHSALIAADGIYARMFCLQAQGFTDTGQSRVGLSGAWQ